MSNCVLCSTELRFTNTPTFNSGKLSDGGELCTSCYKKVNNIDSGVAFKLKKYSLTDIQSIIEKHGINQEQKKLRIDIIKSEIENLKLDSFRKFLGRKEINELPEILSANEKIDNLIQGIYNKGQGILVSTNRRLVFVDKGLLYGLRVEDFPLEKITSIQYETGLIFGQVKIHISANIAVIDQVDKAAARKFAEFVRDKLSQPKEAAQQKIQEPNILDQLEKLGNLKERGILSDEEFQQQKRKLLDKS